MNMAFIEEEDEEAMARYEEEEEEEHKQIVSFLQGYRKSRENTPEEFQFMPGQADDPEGPVLTNEQNQQNESIQGSHLIDGNQDLQGNQELQIEDFDRINYGNYQQGYQGMYPNGMIPLQGYFVNYPQAYLPQSYPQGYPQGVPMAYCNCKACMDLLQMHRQINIQNHGELTPCHTQEDDQQDKPGDMTSPPLTPGRITPASTIGSSSIEYYEDGVSTDDDVELPPHLCGSVTPEERHQFGQAKTGPHSIAARRRQLIPMGQQMGHYPRGFWPMQGQINGQGGQYMFDSIR